MSYLYISLIVLVVIIVGYYVYKHYFNTLGLSCKVNTDCSSGQYCGLVSKKCLATGSCITSAAGKPDDCGNAGTCVAGKCQLKTGYCHSVGPISPQNPSDCPTNNICVASTSQCQPLVPPTAAPDSTRPSLGAPCVKAEDCAANDGWPNSKTTLPCNYYCDLSKPTNNGGNTYGICAASTCCTAATATAPASGCPNANYPAANTNCDGSSGFCCDPSSQYCKPSSAAAK